jgi:hypothetical protein
MLTCKNKVLSTSGENFADGILIMWFVQARQVDQYNVTSMDEYAMLLRTRGDHAELNHLVHGLLNIDSTRPEVWVASAIYWEMRDDKPRALTYAEKACSFSFSLSLSLSLFESPESHLGLKK